MKRLCYFFLCLFLIVGVLSGGVSAAEPSRITSIEYFEDGSYCISVITTEAEYAEPGGAKVSQTKSGTKTKKYYDSDGVLAFSVMVSGTFTYNGSNAVVTSAGYGYSIHKSGWSYSSGYAYCSGATANAACTFRYNSTISKTGTATLTCSPTGVLS